MLEQILSRYPQDRSSLDMILRDVQSELGHLPREALAEIATHLELPAAEILSVIASRDDLAPKPQARPRTDGGPDADRPAPSGRSRTRTRKPPRSIVEVDAAACRACGACEEACPFYVPRVVRRIDGVAIAEIRAEACRGCGVCVAACPTGALRQLATDREAPQSDGGLLVVACKRCGLRGPASSRLSEAVTVLELPCVGAVGPTLLIGALARGFDGVLVLGHHQETCRLNGAEDHAQLLVERMDDLAEFAGLGRERLRFMEPARGRDGPFEAIEEMLADLVPNPLRSRYTGDLDESLDGIDPLMTWLLTRRELTVSAAAWLAEKGLPTAEPGRPVLVAGALPWREILMGEWLREDELTDTLVDALAVLRALGIEAGVATERCAFGDARLAERYPGSRFYTCCPDCARAARAEGLDMTHIHDLLTDGAGLPAQGTPRIVAVDPAQAEVAAIARRLGHEVVDAPAVPPLGRRAELTAAERLELTRILDAGAAAGAGILALAEPDQLMQFLLLRRAGAWRSSHVRPLLATSLAAADLPAREV